MSDLQDLLRDKNEKEKAAFWNRIRSTRCDKYSELFKSVPALYRNRFIDAVQHETDGGNCPTCGQAWVRVTFNNRFLAGFYFQPACECYPLCPSCHRWAYDEFDDTCSNCGWKFIVNGVKRYGVDYEREMYALDRAAELQKKYEAWKKPKAAGYTKKIKMEDDA